MLKSQEGVLRKLVLLACVAGGLPLSLPSQVVLGFDPPFGTTNEQVVITGSGFDQKPLVVTFNGATNSTAQATSSTTIYARVPVGATTGPITVYVRNSSASSATDFKVLGLGPYITGFEPLYAMPNETVKIYGWHLTNLTSVKFAGKPSPSSMANAGGYQITATVPTGATNGPITVTTAYGTSNTLDSFTVVGQGPYVSGFFPPVGNVGDEITLSGANFSSATGVNFAGKPGTGLFVQGAGTIKVKAPAGVVTGPLTVLSPKGNFTTASNFFVPPVVSGFSPVSGRAGSNIVVRGQNLIGARELTIGGIPASSLVATNNTNLLAVVPVGVRTGPVRVNTPAGSATTASNYSVPPIITGFAPPFGAPGTNVVITGANLNEGQPSFKFGAVTAAVTKVAFDSLTVLVPTGAITAPLSVTTTNGAFTTPANFLLPPILTAFQPANAAPGTAVVLSGTNFLSATNVSFNGLSATFLPVTNNNQITAVVPESVTTGPITITTPAGASTLGTFYGPPRIDGFEPAQGAPGVMLTVTGTNFQGASLVKIGDLPAPDFQAAQSGGEIHVRVPSNAVSGGKISVTTPGGVAVSSASFVLDLGSALSLTMFGSPNQVYVGSNVFFDVLISNAGPSPAPNVVLESLLPPALQLQSYTNSQGAIFVSNQWLRAELGLLSPSNVANLRLTLVARLAGAVTTSATISSDYPDPDPADNTATVSTSVLPLPLLSIGRYSPSQILIGWPAALSNFNLQYRDDLNATSAWRRLQTPPTLVGSNYIVIEATTGDERSYRLLQ